MGDRAQKEAFVTLATNDTYALGCLVLANSLRNVHTTRRIVIMVTPGVSMSTRIQLGHVFDEVIEVNVLDSKDAVNLQLLGRPDLSVTFTKLHCWRLTQYNKCVFLDADTLVIRNVDELFDREELSAAPDAGWPDCFNSGVFVFEPNEETYRSILQFAMTVGTFDGGDQGLLNLYFRNWATQDIKKHLPFIYNVVSQAFYSYLPAFTQFRDTIKIVHFIGAIKPWHHPYDTKTKQVMTLPGCGHSQEFLAMWWDVFMSSVQPSLDPSLMPFQKQLLAPHVPHPTEHESTFVSTNQHYHEPTYQIVFPFVPPQLDKVFYTPPLENYSEDSMEKTISSDVVYTSPQVISISQDPIKSYMVYETHYPEEPLSLVDPETTLHDIYSAASLELEMDINKMKTGELKTDSSPDEQADRIISIQEKDEIKEHYEIVKSAGEPEVNKDVTPTDTETDDQTEDDTYYDASSDYDASTSVDSKSEKDTDENSNDTNGTEMGGLIGQLANLQLQEGNSGDGIVILDDQERKLAWERGQMDYLGADSFENIQKKLDEVMANNSASRSISKSAVAKESKQAKEKEKKDEKEPPKKGKGPDMSKILSGTESSTDVVVQQSELSPPLVLSPGAIEDAVAPLSMEPIASVPSQVQTEKSQLESTVVVQAEIKPTQAATEISSSAAESDSKPASVVVASASASTSEVAAPATVPQTAAGKSAATIPKSELATSTKPIATTPESVAAPLKQSLPSAPPKSVPPAAPPKSVPPAAPPKSVPPAAPPKSVPPAAPPKSVPPAAPPKSVPPAAPPKSVPPAAPPKSVPPAAPPKSVPPAAPSKSVPLAAAPPTTAPKPTPPAAPPKPAVAKPEQQASAALPKAGTSVPPAAPPKPWTKPASDSGAKGAPTPPWLKQSSTAGSLAPKSFGTTPKPSAAASGAVTTTPTSPTQAAPAPPPKPGSKFAIRFPPPKK